MSTSSERVPSVVFLCVHNAGRSQMAAALLRERAGDAVRVYSGGSDPAAEVNPVAVEAMRERGIDIESARPARWTDELIREATVVITMGCGDSCPFFPGVRYVDWELDDPAGQPLGVVRRIRDEIDARVTGLLDELGLEGTPNG